MAKFPFTHFFDRNGNGQMDFTEELLAMKVFEDALPGEEPASCDQTENDGLDDGFSDEIDEGDTDSLIDPAMTLHSPDFTDDGSNEIDLEDINSLIDQDLGLHSPDFLEDGLDEDAAIWDDLGEDDEDVWEDSQEEAEEEPVAYLSLSWESREDRFAKQGVRREDYPTQRAYDAACDLIDLQNGQGYVPSDSTRQREIERRQFLVEGGCVAARYLTIHDGFLYAQAVKENFPLPISVPDEDERPVTALDDLFLDLAEEDPALAVRVWAWIIKEFGPYPQYMDGVWMPFNGLLYLTFRFPPEFQEIALEELCQNSDFRRGLLEASPEFPDVDAYIAYALSHGREDQAATLLKSALKNPHGKGVLYEKLVKDMMSHMIEGRDPEPWEALERTVFPILEGLPDKCTQRLLPQWKEEVAQRIQWRRPRPAPQPSQYADPLAATDKTVYTFCGVRFPGWQRVYYYRTDDETLSVGDQVLVPGRDGPTPAEVVSIQKHRRDTAPYPVDRAKFVVGKARGSSSS